MKAPKRNSPSRLWRLAMIGAVTLLLLWIIGQTAREATWLTGLCFFIPSPVMLLVLTGMAMVNALRRRGKLAGLAACLALAPLVFVLFIENRLLIQRRAAPQGQFRLVQWNIWGRQESAGVEQFLLDQQADMYVLNEFFDDESMKSLCRSFGPEYDGAVFQGLGVIVRGKLQGDWLFNSGRVKILRVHWTHGDGHTDALVVDFPSDLDIARGPMLAKLDNFIKEHQPDLVVGDFNAPRRSRFLTNLPAGYAHAYDTAGAGWGYTWPVPAPLFAIDQCIHSSRIIPCKHSLISTWESDHRAQVFEFSK